MPCKCVVMAGDSAHLDALQFRQMSGRAGRRGLDNLGNVVFYHVPMTKVHRLRTAPLPRLRGQFLLTPTLVLRLMLLEQQLKGAPTGGSTASGTGSAKGGAAGKGKGKGQAGSTSQDAVVGQNLLARILQQPYLSHATREPAPEAASAAAAVPTANEISRGATGRGQASAAEAEAKAKAAGSAATAAAAAAADGNGDPAVQQQLLHSLSLSVRLLADLGLVNAKGHVAGLSGMATHLFWTEPSNFVLVRLLTSGALHQLLAECKGAQDRLEKLGLVLAHLFCRMPMHPARARMLRRTASGVSGSVVVLPALPPRVKVVVDGYNQHVMDAAVACIVDYASAREQQYRKDRLEAQAGVMLDQAMAEQAAMEIGDVTLPLSGISIVPVGLGAQLGARGCAPAQRAAGTAETRAAPPAPASTAAPAQAPAAAPLLAAMAAAARPSVAASPLLALTGRGDDFDSVQELVSGVRGSLAVARAAIPLLTSGDRLGWELPLNAYIYDYFKHGSWKDLVRYNDIPEGDAWDQLRNVQGVLRAVDQALQLLVDKETAAARGSSGSSSRNTGNGHGSSNGSGVVSNDQRMQDLGDPSLNFVQDEAVGAGPEAGTVVEEVHTSAVVGAFHELTEKFCEKFRGFSYM